VIYLVGAPLAAQGSGGAEPGASPHTDVTPELLRNAQQSGDWLMYGGNYWNNRYSPLTQINAQNVRTLVPRMVFQSGVERLGSFETTPIVVNGIMYITTPATPNNIVIAIDLRTQKTLWRYEHKNATVSTACCGPNNRGVAIAGGTCMWRRSMRSSWRSINPPEKKNGVSRSPIRPKATRRPWRRSWSMTRSS
jgi:glucose dehydrogenase